MSKNVIEVRNVNIKFPMKIGTVWAANSVDLDIPKGKITALVGESGSGKSTIASAMLKAVSSPGIIESGSIRYNGTEILDLDKEKLQKYKWNSVAMVFQAAQNALNPVMTIREQLVETYYCHVPNEKEDVILEKAKKVLEYVRLEPNRILKAYPNELSGGMKQRVMIAFSLLLDPELLILDEPTTALDVITQDYIFEILEKIHKELGITMLLLTHDIGVVAKFADRVAVMYAGKIVEIGNVFDIFENPKHPYTKSLIGAAPSLEDDKQELVSLNGAPPNLLNLPSGCAFNPRCEQCKEICSEVVPEEIVLDDSIVFCHKHNKKYAAMFDVRSENDESEAAITTK